VSDLCSCCYQTPKTNDTEDSETTNGPHRRLYCQRCDISLWQHKNCFSNREQFRRTLYIDCLLVLRPYHPFREAPVVPKRMRPVLQKETRQMNINLVVLPVIASATSSLVLGRALHAQHKVWPTDPATIPFRQNTDHDTQGEAGTMLRSSQKLQDRSGAAIKILVFKASAYRREECV
jgi:hypothetical protein